MQESFFHSFIEAIHSFCNNIYGVIVGLIVSIAGYFLPVKDIVNLLLGLFLLDVAIGFWAANKLRNERFSVKIIWGHTVPRMLISIVLILGAYMWDKVYDQNMVSTYKLIGWFISGVLLYSIAENGYQVTNWQSFLRIGSIFRTNFKDKTGMDIDVNSKENGSENN